MHVGFSFIGLLILDRRGGGIERGVVVIKIGWTRRNDFGKKEEEEVVFKNNRIVDRTIFFV